MKTLTWSAFKADSKWNMLPAFFIDGDYDPVAVRVYADKAPVYEDAEFTIYEDGESIFQDRSSPSYYPMGGVSSSATTVNTATLSVGSNSEEVTGNLKNDVVSSGSWLTCFLSKDGSGRNFTVQLDLEKIE